MPQSWGSHPGNERALLTPSFPRTPTHSLKVSGKACAPTFGFHLTDSWGKSEFMAKVRHSLP